MSNDRPSRFFVVGAAKCGTTSVHHYLAQHPDIFLPKAIKETNYFVYSNRALDTAGAGNADQRFQYLHRTTITDAEDYEALYAEAGSHQLRGEVCPRYLYYPNAARNIKEYAPDAKIIAILRNPIDRAFSHYKMLSEYGLAPNRFFRELELEDDRIKSGWAWDWHYCGLGAYFSQMTNLLKYFDKSSVKVFLYRELARNPEQVMSDIFSFLEVDDHPISVGEKHMVSYLPKSQRLHALLGYHSNFPGKEMLKKIIPRSVIDKVREPISRINQSKSAPSADEKAFILKKLRTDITKLEDLIQKDLNFWMG